MRRHVIIGRFGPDDKTRVPKARDEVASTLQLVAGTVRPGHPLRVVLTRDLILEPMGATR